MITRPGSRARSSKASPSGLFIILQKKNKMDIRSSFSTDETLENEGKVFPLSKTASIKVARSGNDKYVEMLRNEMKEAQLDLMGEKEANEVAEKILIRVMASTILLGWSGVKEGDVEVPYSAKKAEEYLSIKDFRKKVSGLADNFEAFRVKAEAEQKNA